jgi:hypothetical protein
MEVRQLTTTPSRQTDKRKKVSDAVIEFQGLTVVQVSQNQAAVVSDPQNQIFVVKNSGFVAFAVEGSYDVLSIVDQTHLPGIVIDKLTGVTLGWTHEVKMKSKVGHGQEKDYVVALLLVSRFSFEKGAHFLQLEHTRKQLCDSAAWRRP